MTDGHTVFEAIREMAVDIFQEEGLKQRLLGNKPLRVKFGADPSRPDLHLGHTVPLRMLRRLQQAGHEIIFVIGDFTGMIGDPSGKSKTRQPLTFEETRENGRSYMEQVSKILDPEKTSITYNSQWLSQMNFGDVLLLAGKYTLARILERDDFSTRFQTGQAIGVHELLYPLMQGYDSVALQADIEVGGTDQTFNLLVGRELQKEYGQTPQEVITFPLLIGLDGREKMSKSLDNYIGIHEPPEMIFEKCMKVPDSLLADYFRLTTDLKETDYAAILTTDIRQAHFCYAREIVRLYHGPDAIEPAEQRYLAIAAGQAPEQMDTLVFAENGVSIVELLKLAGFATSKSDARRLIQGKGIRLDGATVQDTELIIRQSAVVSRGKNRFVRVEIAPKP